LTGLLESFYYSVWFFNKPFGSSPIFLKVARLHYVRRSAPPWILQIHTFGKSERIRGTFPIADLLLINGGAERMRKNSLRLAKIDDFLIQSLLADEAYPRGVDESARRDWVKKARFLWRMELFLILQAPHSTVLRTKKKQMGRK